MTGKAYFLSVFDCSREFLARLPASRQAPTLDFCMAQLRPWLDTQRGPMVTHLTALVRDAAPVDTSGRAVGMNSIGLLADRLSILVLKEWSLATRKGRPGEAQAVRVMAEDIAAAMAEARPGSPDLLGKVTTLKSDAAATRWEEAYFGLFAANVLLWEAQEILYGGDMDSVPDAELRAYIGWFSVGNMLRNDYISLCERLYWAEDGVRHG
jgi:hypothetical protein